MKPTSSTSEPSFTAEPVICLAAPPPEIEFVEGTETIARWVLAGGMWVNDDAFTPRIGFGTALAEASV